MARPQEGSRMSPSSCVICFSPTADGDYCPLHQARAEKRRAAQQAKEARIRRWKLRAFAGLLSHQEGRGSGAKETQKEPWKEDA